MLDLREAGKEEVCTDGLEFIYSTITEPGKKTGLVPALMEL